jgi:hypothetical protein
MKLISYEILDHGMDHSQYFQGCGTAYTDFTNVWTGAGNNAKEAYNDALDQAYMDIGGIADKFPKRPAGIRSRPCVPVNSEDMYFYVSIRARIQEEKK